MCITLSSIDDVSCNETRLFHRADWHSDVQISLVCMATLNMGSQSSRTILKKATICAKHFSIY